MEAIIVGGGIGGLSACISLRRAGVDAHLYEQAPRLEEIGAGLSLWANGVKALRPLGIADAVAAATSPIHFVGNRPAMDAQVDLIDLRPVHGQLGVPSVAMHRGELLQLLLDACPSDTIHTNKRLDRVDHRSGQVSAHFSDDTTESADILVAADGVRSEVRRLLTGATAQYAGYSTYRSVLSDFDPGSAWPSRAIIRTLGRGYYFGLGEMGPGRYLWFLTEKRPSEFTSSHGHKHRITDIVTSWAPPIPDVVEATPEEAILLHPIYKLGRLKTWHHNRILLLGDAAHPIEPALGMGAALAIEDAVVLGECLATNDDHHSAFERYERLRVPRVRKLVRWSALLARSEQMSNPLMCRMRDLSWRLTPPNLVRLMAHRAFDFVTPEPE